MLLTNIKLTSDENNHNEKLLRETSISRAVAFEPRRKCFEEYNMSIRLPTAEIDCI